MKKKLITILRPREGFAPHNAAFFKPKAFFKSFIGIALRTASLPRIEAHIEQHLNQLNL